MSERTNLRRNIRRVAYAGLALGILAALYLATRPRPLAVDLVPITRGRIVVTVEDEGHTRVTDRYVVSAPIAGTLARITLEPGDTVTAGMTVGQLTAVESGLLDARARAAAEAQLSVSVASQAQMRAEVTRAETAARFAADGRARADALLAGGGMSRTDADRARYEAESAGEALASARFAFRVAEHEVSVARAALTRGNDAEALPLLSPVDGVVLRVITESAGVVAAGQQLLEIGDPHHLELVVGILTTEAVSVDVGDPVALVRWGGAGDLRGRVRVKEPSAYTARSALGVEEQRVRVIIELLDAPERRAGLADGYRVEAQIEIDSVDGAIRVPSSALFRDGASWAAYAIRDGRAKKVRVRLGLETPELAEVLSGLTLRDRVIAYPGDEIADGVLIEARH